MKIRMYRKLIAVVVGMLALQFGVELFPEQQQQTADVIVMLLTAFGVFAVPNATE